MASKRLKTKTILQGLKIKKSIFHFILTSILALQLPVVSPPFRAFPVIQPLIGCSGAGTFREVRTKTEFNGFSSLIPTINWGPFWGPFSSSQSTEQLQTASLALENYHVCAMSRCHQVLCNASFSQWWRCWFPRWSLWILVAGYRWSASCQGTLLPKKHCPKHRAPFHHWSNSQGCTFALSLCKRPGFQNYTHVLVIWYSKIAFP